MKIDELFSFIESTLRYAENNEIEDHKTNQECAGVLDLFQGFALNAWKEMNFSQFDCR